MYYTHFDLRYFLLIMGLSGRNAIINQGAFFLLRLFWLQVVETQLKLAREKKKFFQFKFLKSSWIILTSSYPNNLSGTNHFHLFSLQPYGQRWPQQHQAYAPQFSIPVESKHLFPGSSSQRCVLKRKSPPVSKSSFQKM